MGVTELRHELGLGQTTVCPYERRCIFDSYLYSATPMYVAQVKFAIKQPPTCLSGSCMRDIQGAITLERVLKKVALGNGSALTFTPF